MIRLTGILIWATGVYFREPILADLIKVSEASSSLWCTGLRHLLKSLSEVRDNRLQADDQNLIGRELPLPGDPEHREPREPSTRSDS
jgi:hypothetical protein